MPRYGHVGQCRIVSSPHEVSLPRALALQVGGAVLRADNPCGVHQESTSLSPQVTVSQLQSGGLGAGSDLR